MTSTRYSPQRKPVNQRFGLKLLSLDPQSITLYFQKPARPLIHWFDSPGTPYYNHGPITQKGLVMPINITDYYLHTAEWSAANASASQLIMNCLESIDASLWLIGGRRVPQALILLANSIEIAFKAELERIHRVLIADNRRLDYSALKSLLRDAFLAHPRGGSMTIPEFEMDRTITFADAMDRVRELYPMINAWKPRLQELYGLRNDIVHYGASEKQDGAYTNAVATIAFPFLTDFLQEAQGVSVEKVTTTPVYRELQVARQVCERIRVEGRQIGSWALTTAGHKMLHIYVQWPLPTDPDGCVQDDSEAKYQMAKQMRNKLSSAWNDCFIERQCRICGESSCFVRVEPLTPERRALAVTAVRCPSCDLSIHHTHTYLAEYHVGALTAEEVEAFLKDIGE